MINRYFWLFGVRQIRATFSQCKKGNTLKNIGHDWNVEEHHDHSLNTMIIFIINVLLFGYNKHYQDK